MIDIFLKAKHWQLFLITVGVPFFIQAITVPMTILGNDPMMMLKLFPVMMLFFAGGILGWFWSIGVGLQTKVPEGVKLKVSLFKTLLIIPVVYMAVIIAIIVSSRNGLFLGQETSGGIIAFIVVVGVIMHLFSMFCMFHTLYFVAKTFKTVELNRAVDFSDFAGEFFMLWFFPIGIWIVQPKVNKMIEDTIY